MNDIDEELEELNDSIRELEDEDTMIEAIEDCKIIVDDYKR